VGLFLYINILYLWSMTTLTVKINERTKKGKAFLEFAKNFLKEGKDVIIIEEEKSPYNPEFVKKVLDSAKSKKRYRIDPNNVWESIL
jgi:uncharacterized protein DUF2683